MVGRSSAAAAFMVAAVQAVVLCDASTPPANCKAAMDADCNADTACTSSIHAAGGALPLVALLDTDEAKDAPAWRCYSPSALADNNTKYSSGDLYCSRTAQLEAVLAGCSTNFVFRSGENNTHCFRIPNILQTPGALLVFAEAREQSCSDSGPKYLAVRRSTDGGASWGPVAAVVRDPAGTADGLNLGTSTLDATTGEVFVHFTTCAHACPTAGLFAAASRDSGATWAPPVNLTAVAVAAGWAMVNPGPGTGVQLADGRLVVPFWGRRVGSKNVEGGVGALYSDDHGETWQFSSKPVLSTPDMDLNECQLAVQSNGSILLNVRDEAQSRGHYARVLTRSDDGGDTWNAPWRSPTLTSATCMGSMISFDAALSSSSSSPPPPPPPSSSSLSSPRRSDNFTATQSKGAVVVATGVDGKADATDVAKATRHFAWSAPADLLTRTTGFVRTSVDDGATWWLQNPRVDTPSGDTSGFGYSGLVDMGPAPGSDVHVRNLGIVFETAGEAAVVFRNLTIRVA